MPALEADSDPVVVLCESLLRLFTRKRWVVHDSLLICRAERCSSVLLRYQYPIDSRVTTATSEHRRPRTVLYNPSESRISAANRSCLARDRIHVSHTSNGYSYDHQFHFIHHIKPSRVRTELTARRATISPPARPTATTRPKQSNS